MDTARKNADAAAVETEAPDSWLSIWRAARELGIGYSTVLSKAANGDLELKRFDPPGRFFVSRASVERAKQHA